MNDLVKRLIEHFRDRAYREGYATDHLTTALSQQLTRVREQRGLSQTALAEAVGTKQSGISRLESRDYGGCNIATLQKIAFALDCRLKVSLETYGSLLKRRCSQARRLFRGRHLRKIHSSSPVRSVTCAAS